MVNTTLNSGQSLLYCLIPMSSFTTHIIPLNNIVIKVVPHFSAALFSLAKCEQSRCKGI